MASTELYLWTTPNGYKPLLLLEELGTPYEARPIHIGKGEQHTPAFLEINPNGKIPALVDRLDDGRTIKIFESGAILVYLAEKSGKFLPAGGQERADVLSWLMFQMGGVGPMLGQYGHFKRVKPDVEYGLERYGAEAKRLLSVLEGRLSQHPFLAGEYSIADMATYPWIRGAESFYQMDLSPYPALQRWLGAIGERPATRRAYAWTP